MEFVGILQNIFFVLAAVVAVVVVVVKQYNCTGGTIDHHHRRQKNIYFLKDSDKFHFKFLLPCVSFNNVFKESVSFVFLSLKQILTTPIVKFVLQKTLDETSYQLK